MKLAIEAVRVLETDDALVTSRHPTAPSNLFTNRRITPLPLRQ